jgi:hypothetical protein
MPAAALEAEVNQYTAESTAETDERACRRLVVRNSHHRPRTVAMAAGPVEVTVVRVKDRRVDESAGERKRFSSTVLPPSCRKSPKASEALPLPGPAWRPLRRHEGALNAGVARFSADATARRDLSYDSDLTGQITIPVLTLHAIEDPQVFVEHEAAYHAIVRTAGRERNLVQTFARESEHWKLSIAF